MKTINFNDNWILQKEDGTREAVCLPHDAMLSEPRSNLNPGGKNAAWFRGADYVYEKKFTLGKEYADSQIVFEFEGVYRNAEVFVNGVKAAYRPYGYTNFYVNATELLFFEKENEIKVRVQNSDQPNSRWYSGAGIYRPVSMIVLPQKHIKINGVKVKTIDYVSGEIEVSVKTSCAGTVCVTVKDGDSALAQQSALTEGETKIALKIPQAKLWSDNNPNFYDLTVSFEGDACSLRFGIRQIACSADSGLLINGRRVVLRGACAHHDNGLLGAAAHDFAERRKVQILKKAGYNAVRCAHNPCSKAFLRACDELGMLVLDEYVDMWYIHKTRYDYADHFMEWHEQDLRDMVDKDYNHPSVIMYSTGNEVSETAQEKGIGICGEMTKLLHELDDTRPVTCGINIFFNYLSSMGFGVYSDKKASKVNKKPKKEKAVGSEFFNNLAGIFGDKTMKIGAWLPGSDKKSKDAFARLDVAGYNYGILRYKKDLKKYPDRVILGSETFCKDAYKFWELAKADKAVIGDFVWAGIDYIGEVGIGAWVYRDHAPDFKGGAGWISSGSGRIDITGRENCEAAYTKVAYEIDKIRLGVIPVNNYKKAHSPSAWKMSNAIESWSWEGYEGMKTQVEVYARGHKVALFINSVKVGEKKLKDGCKRTFKVKYRDGQILAVVYDKDNQELARASLTTAGKENKLTLTPENGAVPLQDGLIYVRMQYTDDKNVLKPLLSGPIKVEVEGGKLLGLGHACPYNADGYLKDVTQTYYGDALAIVKPLKAGTVTVSASSPYGDASVTVKAE